MRRSEAKDVRRRLTAVAAVLLIATCATVAVRSVMAPQLLRVARRVPALDGADRPIWLSDHEAIVNFQTVPAIFDLRSGSRRPFPRLRNAVARLAAPGNCGACSSPDGKWVLVYSMLNNKRAEAVPVSGAEPVNWKLDLGQFDLMSQVSWVPGTHNWAFETGFYPDILLREYDVDNPRSLIEQPLGRLRTEPPTEQTVTVGVGGPASTPQPTSLIDGIVCAPDLPPAITVDGRLVQYVDEWRDVRDVQWYCTLGLTGKPARQVPLPTQQGERIESVASSRDGRRLAWVVWRTPARKAVWWQRITAKLGMRDTDVEKLIVTDQNGQNPRVVGETSVDVFNLGMGSSAVAPNDAIEAVQWLPGGNSLSFTFRSKAWIVNAPE